MNIGCHVSIAGGVEKAPERASSLGCETFQIFARSPRGRGKDINDRQVREFKSEMKRYGFRYFYIHAPYYINLASSNKRIYYGSINALRKDLDDGSRLGARALMTHIGSSKDLGKKKSIDLVVDAIEKILDGYFGSCQFLLELSAGAGGIIGDRFEEIGEILSRVKSKHIIGVCFDTQHVFASGYDIRTRIALNQTLDEFDRYIGLEKLELSHVNDSKTELGSNKDRHENIGKGLLGEKTFELLIHHPKTKHLDLILETPVGGEIYKSEIGFLKEIRDRVG